MLLIPCPHCGPRNQEEFTYERTRDSVVRLDDAPEVAVAALYARANPRGEEIEIWHHACGQWLQLVRDRMTHAIRAVEPL
jgi:sarcosine oxidase subunit delta